MNSKAKNAKNAKYILLQSICLFVCCIGTPCVVRCVQRVTPRAKRVTTIATVTKCAQNVRMDM